MKIAFISLGTLGPGAPHWTGQILSRGHNLLFYVPATRNKTHIKLSSNKTFHFQSFLWFVILHLHDSKRHLHCSTHFQQNRGHNILCQDKIKHLDPPKNLNQMSKMHPHASNKTTRIFPKFSYASVLKNPWSNDDITKPDPYLFNKNPNTFNLAWL